MSLNSAQKMKKIREILDETPNIAAVYPIDGKDFVKLETYVFLHEQMKAISKIVGARF